MGCKALHNDFQTNDVEGFIIDNHDSLLTLGYVLDLGVDLCSTLQVLIQGPAINQIKWQILFIKDLRQVRT